MRKITQIFLNILFTIIVIAILLLILEVGFRLGRGKDLYLKQTTGIRKARSKYLFKPNRTYRSSSSKWNEFDVGVRINNYGFRGKDIDKKKKPGILRIFAVGDSFTWGVGARENETIPYLLEENLKSEGFRVEVINAGRGHASTIGYYLKLRDIFLSYEPDLVILLFDFSDLWEDWDKERHLVYDDNGKILFTDHTFINGKRDWWLTLMQYSELCTYLNNKIVRTFKKIKVLGFKDYLNAKLRGKRAKAVISNMDLEASHEDNLDTIEYDGRLFLRGRDKLPLIKKHWARTEKYLLMIRDLLAEKGVAFIMTMHPYGIHVGPEQWNKGRVYWGFEQGRTYDDYFAYSIVEEFARENKILCINTLEAFLREKDKKLFFDYDGHLTPQGNRIFADFVTQNEGFLNMLDEIGKGKIYE